MRLETMTPTGFPICDPENYWAELKSHYPDEKEREQAQAEGRDHFGSYGLIGGDFRCYRCGFVCEGDEE